ncbi:DNA processing protein [Orenia metallireducens]|uniref:DNA processing protein n=1 Tax=Orenia metallireducens TaxID=1413210 RepID=A0A285FQ38_9FIRM|nr:DNA-processing protein DprA [Orenia metallireducens]PRX33687.1 DNA processing protein [Orenia metallireducens]SNY13432.1 DNA processing protein [Orenia metallireducens]
MEDKLYWVWLNQIKGLGPIKVKNLLDYFTDAKGVWESNLEEITAIEGIGSSLGNRIITSKGKFDFEKEYISLNKFGVKVVTLVDKCYPKLLKEIYDSPPVLYYKGDLSKINRPSLSIVGSRRYTTYGKAIANKLSKRLTELGVNIVSGMARGIDTFAHQGALEGGITYAILGSGIDHIYPPENAALAKRIAKEGAILTPFHLGTRPFAKNFPARNRIISGLSLGTIVVEATRKSGSLITADMALEQGREVFAIPGDITKEQSQGTNRLIKSGAKLVQNIDDILEELPLLEGINSYDEEYGINLQKDNSLENRKNKLMKELSEKQKIVYRRLSYTPQQFEYLLNTISLNSAQLNTVLLELEIKGMIEQLPGKRFRLAN